MVAQTELLVFDPFDPAQMADPYPVYRRLRDEAPLAYLKVDDLWVLSRYDDCLQAVRDVETFFSKAGFGALMSGGLGRRDAQRSASAGDPFSFLADDLRVLIALDPPDHTRLRRLVNRPFTPRAIEACEARVRPLCETLFADLMAANDVSAIDWARDFAWPFPIVVIAHMLGIPEERRDDFKRWSDDLVGLLGSLDTDIESGIASFMEMFQFFHDAIRTRRHKPGDDLISLLIHNTEADDETLTAEELVMFCVLLLVAGNETTTNLLSNGLRALADPPDALDRFRRDSASIPPAVEEMLRYDGPIQGLPRATTRSTIIAGTTIPADANVLVLCGSANRDERHFPKPDTFDIDRNPTDHLAFGHGIHLCLGAPLARLEARIAFETLAANADMVELTAAPTPTPAGVLRGATSMPIRLHDLAGATA